MQKSFLLTAVLFAVVITGAGCAPESAPTPSQPAQEQKADNAKPKQDAAAPTTGTWVHPQYEFSFTLPLGTSSKFESMDSVDFVDPASQKVYGEMAIAPEIPGIPLPESLIDEVMVDGVKGNIYHDTDAETGKKKIDKLMVVMPGTNKTIYIAVPVEFKANMDLVEVTKMWKWKK